MSLAFYRAFFGSLTAGPHGALDATLLTLLVLCTGVLYRCFLARPEVFAMGWAVFALSRDARRPASQALLVICSFNQYPLFDWMAAALAHGVGVGPALKALQAGALALVHRQLRMQRNQQHQRAKHRAV